jgi:hypothetical protein
VDGSISMIEWASIGSPHSGHSNSGPVGSSEEELDCILSVMDAYEAKRFEQVTSLALNPIGLTANGGLQSAPYIAVRCSDGAPCHV